MLRALAASCRLLAAAALVCALGAPARAEPPADVEALIALVREQPEGMSRDDWKEKRREAARALGRLGDDRAVPVLIEVVGSEQFDVIAEIAIESLGRLGDDRAVPVLQEVVQDASRDRYVREAAKTALQRIGAAPAPAQAATAGGGANAAPAGVSAGSSLLGDGQRRDIPAGPAFAGDVLAASERITFAAGDVTLEYDNVSDVAVVDGDVRGRYERTVEHESAGYRYGGEAALVAGVLDLPGDDSLSRVVTFNASADVEARAYLASRPVFGLATVAAGVQSAALRNNPGTGDTVEELRLGLDLHIGIGLGYGRVLDVGEGLRVRRLEKVLAEARMLGRPITPDLAAELMRTWWALRGEQGGYRHLVATVAILRDAGVLLGEPDAGTAYEMLQVLLDGQLQQRFAGYDARIGFGESFLIRDDDLDVEDGRIEHVFAQARFASQADDAARELVGRAAATYRVFADADEGDASPWVANAQLAWRRYFYNDAWDPIGALELAGGAGASDGFEDAGEVTTRLLGSVGWLWIPNRASRFRLAGHMRLEDDRVFVGVSFDANYGFLDAGFVGGGALPTAIQ